jgi:hypothetical protein
MSEKAKTLAFVAVALAVVILAVVTRPSLQVSGPEDVRNQPLYPDFKDPLSVVSLEMVEFDDQRGEVHPFQVAQVAVKGKTRWSIPSHDDYPADAKDQVASAAAGLMGLKTLEMVSDNQGDQREYGVIDPDPKDLKVGDTGVGKKVIMKNKEGKQVLALVVGKEVPGRAGLRYVRKVGQAPIYVVEAKTDKLSTKFESWIERNLLSINSFDIKQLWIRDYSVDEFNGTLSQRADMEIEYNDTAEPKWKIADDRKFVIDDKKKEGRWEPVKMAANSELNLAKLDELKTALDDLKIVNVARKPAGLSADLKAAADFTNNREGGASLGQKGFFVAKMNEQIELFSNEGEIRVTMKDGVQYILRFGAIAGSGATKKDETKKDEEKDAGVNRYLFVMVEFNPEVIPKPQFQPLPETKKDAEKKPEEKKADDKKPEEKKADAKKPDEKKPDQKNAQDAERERIEKENKRKKDEYDQKIADGKKRVAELNARFADWYYVISDDVYRKIHLTHDEVFKKKEQPKDQAKEPAKEQSKEPAKEPAKEPVKEPVKDQGQEKKGEAAGKENPAAKDAPTPSERLDKMKEEGPGGKK